MEKRNKPYAERDDLERLQSQWTKLSGLHSKKQWSAAVVRAATAAEIAANLAIRKEFEKGSNFNKDIVDNFLIWANGLHGKMKWLLLPMTAAQAHGEATKELKQVAQRISEARNKVVHQGEFCNPEEAKMVIKDARHFVESLVRMFHPEFLLVEKTTA